MNLLKPIQRQFFQAIKEGNLELTQLLITNENLTQNDKNSVLMYVSNKMDQPNYIEIQKLLFQHGVNINHCEGDALRAASSRNNIEHAKFLLEKGANPILFNYAALIFAGSDEMRNLLFQYCKIDRFDLMQYMKENNIQTDDGPRYEEEISDLQNYIDTTFQEVKVAN